MRSRTFFSALHSLVWTGCLTLLLASCGFKLQGATQLAPPLHHLYLQSSDPYGQMARTLKDYLKMSGVQLVDSPNQADTILTILSDNSSQTLLSVNSTQQTRQYTLAVTVMFDISRANGITILPSQTMSDTRTITIQSNDILSSSNEANLYYQQIRRSIATAMMNRIASKQVTTLINQAFTPTPAHKKS